MYNAHQILISVISMMYGVIYIKKAYVTIGLLRNWYFWKIETAFMPLIKSYLFIHLFSLNFNLDIYQKLCFINLK